MYQMMHAIQNILLSTIRRCGGKLILEFQSAGVLKRETVIQSLAINDIYQSS